LKDNTKNFGSNLSKKKKKIGLDFNILCWP